ncbi:MAG: methionine--tRNA ligase [Pseudomonadales bacterium]|nr:methionine--tRNA ligase [Pseudomonadales bacterium]
MTETFYITTTLPYVNADPHIGFALEIIAADVIARYQKLSGKEVIFNTGTDEHGQKIYQKALESEKNIHDYVNFYAEKFSNLKEILNLDYTNFIRTTDQNHIEAAQVFWSKCQKNGDIYKKMYTISYCVGCELEKNVSDLVDGKCPLHPTEKIELIEEENYFFKFSKYQNELLNLYELNKEFVKPEGKLSEISSFVSGGLKDFSISRLKEKMSWGVPIPNDDKHVMYVWFDALVNYVSTIGWPKNINNFNKFWPVIQIAGKDNLRQQAAMWQAMLISAGISNSKQILINGFINVEGQKMSKSLGNVISPSEMFNRYGTDGTRYLLMNLGPFGSDMDVSWDKFDSTFNSALSNGLGNLCSRVAKMCEQSNEKFNINSANPQFSSVFHESMNNFDLKNALNQINDLISNTDKYLSDTQPWTKSGNEQKEILQNAISNILTIASNLQSFTPLTAKKINDHFNQEKISSIKPLFPRLPK